MPVRSGGQAPYAPSATVLSLIGRFRNRGLQAPFNADVLMRAGIPDSLIPRTLQALRLLDLMDAEGNPTAQLVGLQKAPEPEYKQRLEAVVRGAYAEVFQFVDPAKDEASRIKDAFRAFEPIGQIGRMVTMFLGMCGAAGIIPEAEKPPRPTRGPTPKRKTPEPRSGSVSHAANVRTNGGGFVPPAIMGLLAAIPAEGWENEDQRDQFLKTFESVLDFSVKVRPAKQVGAED